MLQNLVELCNYFDQYIYALELMQCLFPGPGFRNWKLPFSTFSLGTMNQQRISDQAETLMMEKPCVSVSHEDPT